MSIITATSRFLGAEVEQFSGIIPSRFSIKENILKNSHIHEYIDTHVRDEIFPQPESEPFKNATITLHSLIEEVEAGELIRNISANSEAGEHNNHLILKCFYELVFLPLQADRHIYRASGGSYVSEEKTIPKFLYPKAGYKPTIIIPTMSQPINGSLQRYIFFTYGDRDYNIHTREIDYTISSFENSYVALLS